jgi:two-component system, cell cycle sensor histidine kinase and response regulator CckA
MMTFMWRLRFEWRVAVPILLAVPIVALATSRLPLVRDFPGVVFIVVAVFASYFAGALVGVLACAEVTFLADALGFHSNPHVINQPSVIFAFMLAAAAGVVVSRAFVRERRARAESAESEARYRKLLESTFDAVILSVDGTIVDVGLGFERLWGYAPEDAIGRPLLDFIAPPSVDVVRENLARRGESPMEVVVTARDGTERIVRVVAQNVTYRGADARLAAITDVTADRAGEAEREAVEQRFRTLFEAVPVGVTLATIDGLYLEANHVFCELAGRSRDEIVGRHFSAFVDERTNRDPDVLAAILQGESGPFEFESSVIRPDGAPVPVRVGIAVVRDADGAPLYSVAVNESIAEQRELEAQVRQTQKMEAIGRLASGIAHDFNNLLTVIGGNVQLLDSAGLGDDAQRRVAEIGAAAERAAGLTRQLLTFSRPREPRLDDVDVNDLVHDVVDGLLRRLIGADVAIDAVLAEDVPHVRADALDLEQVLINLAVNARDAMPEGGHLTIATESVGDQVLLRVADTGTGIDDATQEHIFEPFFTTKPRGEGTGLGLANAYGVVTRAGGTIAVASEVGRGTTFTISLPVGDPPDGPPEERRPLEPSRTGRVLFVDDEAAVRRVAEATLARAGHELVLAADGHEALALLEEGEKVDLLVTDLDMPGMSGLELAERVRATRPELGILFISGYAERILGAGLDSEIDLLEKPFSPVILLERVARALPR